MNYVPTASRVLLALVFLLAGLAKIPGYAGVQGEMESVGVPGMLLPVVIAAEVLGGLALIVGYRTKWAALGLAVFTVLAALLFHTDFADRTQTAMFMKNFAITGGLLLVYLHGAGPMSLDNRQAA